MVQPQEIHRVPLRSVLEAYDSVTSATYTAKAGDRLIGVNRAGAVTITLPTAQLRAGRSYTPVRVDIGPNAGADPAGGPGDY